MQFQAVELPELVGDVSETQSLIVAVHSEADKLRIALDVLDGGEYKAFLAVHAGIPLLLFRCGLSYSPLDEALGLAGRAAVALRRIYHLDLALNDILHFIGTLDLLEQDDGFDVLAVEGRSHTAPPEVLTLARVAIEVHHSILLRAVELGRHEVGMLVQRFWAALCEHNSGTLFSGFGLLLDAFHKSIKYIKYINISILYILFKIIC